MFPKYNTATEMEFDMLDQDYGGNINAFIHRRFIYPIPDNDPYDPFIYPDEEDEDVIPSEER